MKSRSWTSTCPVSGPPLEAQLIDLADEIAYDTADLDDAFSLGLVNAELIAEHIGAFNGELESVQTSFPGASEREQFFETLLSLRDAMLAGLLEGTVEAARTAGVQTYRDVRSNGERIARFTPAMAQATRETKSFLHRFLYVSPGLDAHRRAAGARIGQMFQAFLEHPDRLPPNYAEAALTEPLHRVVCDYIAGMTDPYFDRVYSSEVVKLESSAERTL